MTLPIKNIIDISLIEYVGMFLKRMVTNLWIGLVLIYIYNKMIG